MYNSFVIKNLRGVKSLEVDGLRPINLIVGRNNSGKSTLLEAIFLMGGATNPIIPTVVGQIRDPRWGRLFVEAAWKSLFFGLNSNVPIDLAANWDGTERRLKIEGTTARGRVEIGHSAEGQAGIPTETEHFALGALSLHFKSGDTEEHTSWATIDFGSKQVKHDGGRPEGVIGTSYVSARSFQPFGRDAEKFSVVRKLQREGVLIDALKAVEPRLKRIEILVEDGQPTLYVDIGSPTLIPLAVCGEGFVRCFEIVVEMATSQDGVVLVDEIDNGLHFSAMGDLWRVVARLADAQRTQIFATTHNEDIIRSALDAFAENDTVLGLYRIDRRGDQHTVASYNDEAQEAVRQEHFEVRG